MASDYKQSCPVPDVCFRDILGACDDDLRLAS